MNANDNQQPFNKPKREIVVITESGEAALGVVLNLLSENPVLKGRAEPIMDGYCVELIAVFEHAEISLTDPFGTLLRRPYCPNGIHCAYPPNLELSEVVERLSSEVYDRLEALASIPHSGAQAHSPVAA